MDDHLSYSKNEQSERDNNRNGHSKKQPGTSEEQIELATPRDREGSFEPAIVKKHQTHIVIPHSDNAHTTIFAHNVRVKKNPDRELQK